MLCQKHFNKLYFSSNSFLQIVVFVKLSFIKMSRDLLDQIKIKFQKQICYYWIKLDFYELNLILVLSRIMKPALSNIFWSWSKTAFFEFHCIRIFRITKGWETTPKFLKFASQIFSCSFDILLIND